MDDLQLLLRIIEECCKKMGLTINRKKSKYLITCKADTFKNATVTLIVC